MNLYIITRNKYKILNSDIKINNAPYILYLFFQKSLDEGNVLSVRITNKIKLEWLCSTLPLWFSPINFKSVYLRNTVIEGNTVIEEINGSQWDTICYKIANKSNNGILFDNVIKEDYQVLYNYIKIIKQNIK